MEKNMLSKPVKNAKISHGDIGKGKQCNFKLPDEGFAYGKPDKKDQEGAKEVISSWTYHQQSKTAGSKKDFKNMNKIGVSKGAINAKDQAKFRKDKDIRVPQEPKHKPAKGTVPTDIAFGMVNRPSTPIRDVISNTFGITAEQEFQEKAKVFQTKPASKSKQIRATKSSTLLQQKIKNEDNRNEKLDNFKIKRFTKVESRVKAQMDKDKRRVEEEKE